MSLCPNTWCPWVTGASSVPLLVAWAIWAPYTLRMRAIPPFTRLVAVVLLAAFVVMAVVVMPMACGPCGGRA